MGDETPNNGDDSKSGGTGSGQGEGQRTVVKTIPPSSGGGDSGNVVGDDEKTVVKNIPPPPGEGEASDQKTVVKNIPPPPLRAGKPPPGGKKPPPPPNWGTGSQQSTVAATPPQKTLAELAKNLARATMKVVDISSDGPTDTAHWYWLAKDPPLRGGMTSDIVAAAEREGMPPGQVFHTAEMNTDQASSKLSVGLIWWKKTTDGSPDTTVKSVFWRAKKVVDREEVIAEELKKNNEETWDWITWETLGNPGKDYRRSDRMRKLGLYKLSYDLLRRANKDADKWAPASTQDGEIGGGRVRVHFLEGVDYSKHKALISMFLPGFTIESGRLVEPMQRQSGVMQVSRVLKNTADSSLSLILPYNYDDNDRKSKALGTDIAKLPGYREESGGGRLDRQLDRWSTASRSTIVAFDSQYRSERLHKDKLIWPWRTDTTKREIIEGDPDELLQSDYVRLNQDRAFYSVKTGVYYVGVVDEGAKAHKDLLEANSLHAMYRSQLISAISENGGYAKRMPNTRFQLEILTVTIQRQSPHPEAGGALHWDGFQVRDIPGVKKGEVWFPGTAIPNHGKAFAQIATGDKTRDAWHEFWQKSFAEPLGRAKAEMLVFCGLQHMTANAQNMLVVFGRGQPGGIGTSATITLRDVGDTCLNDTFFAVLKEVADPDKRKLFTDMWSKESASKEHGLFLDRGDWGSYSPPFVTRTMGQSVFFMLRFFEELTVADPSEQCKLALKWNVALNESFMDYMRDNLAYPSPISVKGTGRRYAFDIDVKGYKQAYQEVWDDLESQAFMCEATKDTYPQLVPKLQKLSPEVRKNLLFEVWTKIQDILNSSKPLTKEVMYYLGSAHELLIGIEIDEWVKTPEGKKALLALHGG